MAPSRKEDDRGSGGEEEREEKDSHESSVLKLSLVGEVLRRATEAGASPLKRRRADKAAMRRGGKR